LQKYVFKLKKLDQSNLGHFLASLTLILLIIILLNLIDPLKKDVLIIPSPRS